MSLTIGMFSIYKLNKDNLAPGGRLILTSGTNIKSTVRAPVERFRIGNYVNPFRYI